MINKRLALISLGAILLLTLSKCGANSALPQQASIPPPADDCGSGAGCITVSTDSTSHLTITGDTGAVPASAIVIVSVSVEESSSSSMNLLNILDWIIPSAMASEVCSSSLSECSQETELTSCQSTANEDGSFLIRVLSDATTLTVTYLDPENDCDESESFETEVSSELLTLSTEGSFLTNNEEDTVYVFGTNGDGATNQLLSIDIDPTTLDATIEDPIDLAIAGTPVDIDYLPTTDQLIFSTDTKVGIASAEITNETQIPTITDESTEEPLIVFSTAVQRQYTYSSAVATDTDFSCIENISTLAGTTVDRVFFAREDLRTTDVLLNVLDSGDHTEARTISYNFAGTDLENSTAISVRDVIISLDGSEGFMIAEFENESGVSAFYLIGIPVSSNGFCLEVDASEEIIIELEEIENPGKVFWIGNSNIASTDTSSFMVIPDQGDSTPIVVNLSTDSVINLHADVLGTITKLVPLTFPTPFSFAGISPDSVNLIEFQLEVDNDSSTVDSTSSTELVGIETTDMTLLITSSFDSLTNLVDNLQGVVFTLSNGLEGDGLSYIRAMSLSDLIEAD